MEIRAPISDGRESMIPNSWFRQPETAMSQYFWKRRAAWDYGEIAFVFLATSCAVVSSFVRQDFQRWTSGLSLLFALGTAVAKFGSVRTREIESKIKAEQDERAKELQRQEVEDCERRLRVYKESFDRDLAVANAKTESTVQNVMGAIWDDFHAKYFRNESQEEKHKHRVTLFTCVESEEGSAKDKRLVIFARSGPHKSSTRSWPIDDDYLEKCRGVAGQIWFHGVGKVITAACDWPTDGNTVEKSRYARSMGLTMDEAEALNVKSRVVTGAEIIVRGRKWGVIVLDSLKEGHIIDGSYEKKLLGQCSDLIVSVLSKISS